MLTFTNEQMSQLEAQRVDDYLNRVIAAISVDNADLPNEPKEQLLQRLKEAYQYLVSLNFENNALIVSFLYAEAVTPGFHYIPDIRDWLEKPNTKPEKQYETMLYALEKTKFRG